MDGTGTNVYLIKTDQNGEEQWHQTFDNEVFGKGYSVKQTSDGGYIITGSTYTGNNIDLYLIKTNLFGNITSTFEIPLPNSNRKIEKTVNLKGQRSNLKPVNQSLKYLMVQLKRKS